MRFIIFVLSVLLVCSCSEKKYFKIYFENESESDSILDLSIYANDELLIEDSIYYSDVVPNFHEYDFNLPSGVYVLRFVENSNQVVHIDTVHLDRDKYLLASYKYEIKNIKMYEAEHFRFKTLYPLKKESEFKYDSVLYPRSITTFVMDSVPLIH